MRVRLVTGWARRLADGLDADAVQEQVELADRGAVPVVVDVA